MNRLVSRLARRITRKIRSQHWRLRCALTPNKLGVFTVDQELNTRVRYPLKSSVGYSLSVGNFESAELNYVRNAIRPGDVFLDIGANAGIFSVVAGKRVGPSGHVYAFEPGLAEQALLRQNLTLNNLANVTLFAGAVSNRSGSAQFAVAQDGALSSLAKTEHPLQLIKEWREVPVITVDEYIAREGVTRVDFVKIDVEGAEKLVFEGAARLFSSSSSLTVLFEAYELNAHGFGYSVADFLVELLRRGMKLSRLAENGTLVPITHYESCLGTEFYNFVAQV